MSKFFQALEHAERERTGGRATAVEPADERDARAAGSPPRRPEPERVVERAPGYGAPVARQAAAHEGAFTALLEAPPVLDPGEVDDHLVSLLEPTSFAAEQYRAVRLAIENFRRERGMRLVAMASPARGDGRTMTAINVAGALAQAPDARVVLVEADLRHPSMARALGLSGGSGLSAYLLDPALGIEHALEQPPGLGFAVVLAGSASSMPYELLASPRLGALFAELRESFDYVVLDTPPTLPFPDVGILRELVDGFVMVIRANRTPREEVRESVEAIGLHRVLGMIFNDDERTGAAARSRRRRFRASLARPRGGVRAA